MSWARGIYVGNERCIQERYHLEHLVVDGRKILRLIFKKHCGTAWLAVFNPLNAELNPICHLLALLGGATIVVASRLRVKQDTL